MSASTQQTINSLLHYFFLLFFSSLTHLRNISKVLVLYKTWKIYFHEWLMQFVNFFTCRSDPLYFNRIHIFINTQQIFMFKVSILITFCEKMIKLIISCLNVSFKKLIIWLQLPPKLIASDYITTGRPLGRTKAVHSCVTPQGAWSGAVKPG